MTRWKRSSSASCRRGFLALVFVLSSPALCFAQDETREELPEITPCEGASDLTSSPLGDSPGFWFPRETTRCITLRLAALPRYDAYARRLEFRLDMSDERYALSLRETALAVEEAQVAEGAVEAALRGQRGAEEALEGERRLRWAFFASGMVFTALVIAFSTWIVASVPADSSAP